MKLSPIKGGHGHITAYRAVLGSSEARRAGFLNEDGSSKELEKLVDDKAGTITIRVSRQGDSQSE